MVFGDRNNEITVPGKNTPTATKDKIADRIMEKEESKWTKPLTDEEKNSRTGLIYKMAAVALGVLVIIGFLYMNPSVLGSGTNSGNGGSDSSNNIEKLQNITTSTPTAIPTATKTASTSKTEEKYTTYEQVFSHSKKVNEWIKIGEVRDFEVFGTNVRISTYTKPGSSFTIQMLPPALPKNQKILVNMIYKNTVTGKIVDSYRDSDHSQSAWSNIIKTKNPDEVLWQVEFGLMTDETAVKQQPKKTIV